MKVLITGSAGFVGRQFQRELDGHDLTLIDIVDGLDARTFFAQDDTHFDLVVHLAAIVGGRLTIENQPLSVATDLAIDSDLFQWALRTRPDHLVYYSSSAAYPIALQTEDVHVPLQEKHINFRGEIVPDMSYGWAKLTGELLAEYAQAEGLRVHVFRPFSGYGTDQSLDYPFPSFIDRAKRHLDPFEVWGNGNQVRDYIHISDVVKATITAVREDIQGPVNLGTGIPTSSNELQELICALAGYNPRVEHLPAKPSGVMYRVCDPTKMLEFYKPQVSLDRGIIKALNGII